MIPQTLSVRNFMCYREDVPELRLDGIDIACLSGENGAGKSALLDAITWVLWGKARMSDEELLAIGANEMEVELVFSLGGQDYRVIRKYQRGSGRRSGKSSLDLQVRNQGVWKAIGELQIRQTEEKIVDLLRMKYDTFINSAFLLQGRADEFTRKAPSERKQVLADILDLKEYADLEQKAKERVKQLHDKIKGVESLIEHLQLQADKRPIYQDAFDRASQWVAELNEALERANQRLQRAQEQMRELEDAERLRRERQAQIEKLRVEQAQDEQRRNELQATIAQAEDLLARRDAIMEGIASLNQARKELARLESLRDRFDELNERRKDLKLQLLEEHNSLKSRIELARNELKRLQTRAQQYETQVRELEQNEQQLVELAPLAQQRDELLKQRETLEAQLSRHNSLSLRREQLLKRIEMRRESLVATREENQRLLRRLDNDLAQLPRLQSELNEALQQRDLLENEQQQLQQFKQDEQQLAQEEIDHSSLCKSIQTQAEALKERKNMLSSDDPSCPVCGSELGHDGVEQVRAHYDEELQQLRVDYQSAKKHADQSKQRRAALLEEIQTLEAQIAQRLQIVAKIGELQKSLERLASVQDERAKVQETLDSVVSQIEAKDFDQEAQQELADLQAEIVALGGDTAALESERRKLDQTLRGLESQLRQQNVLEGAITQRRRELELLRDEIAALPEQEATLASLETQLAENDYAHDIRAQGKAIEAEIQALGYDKQLFDETRALVEELSPWQEQQQQLSSADQQIELSRFRLGDVAARIEQRQAEIEQLTLQIQELEAKVRALRGAAAEREQAELEERKLKRDLAVAQRDLGEAEANLKLAVEADAQLMEQENERRALLERHSIMAELAEAYGKKGVQAMLIETSIPEIEREANALLGRMTDNQMHVSVETQRETKKGDTQETLEIKIADTLGTRTYDAFSGGESFRVNFAIRIAMSKLLARRAGARLETLVIDEGFGALDTRGRERLVEAISSVRNDFKRILVITHIQELKDLFPTQIEITKTQNGSVWQIV
mgnify:CR=1 FL=1|jgi:ATPase involved in DNA repair